MPPTEIRLSINRQIIDKTPATSSAHAYGWEAAAVTYEALAEIINQGHAFAPQFKHDHRLGDNFLCASFLAVDVDDTMSLEEARRHEFIKKHATIMYTTPSHQSEGTDRFRIVFATQELFEDGQKWSDATLGLAILLNTDRSATDKARGFYGSRGSAPEVWGNSLPPEVVARLVAEGRRERQDRAKITREALPGVYGSVPASRGAGAPETVTLAGGSQAALSNLRSRTSVYCHAHADSNPSAFVVQSMSGVRGIHCSRCARTYWPDRDRKAEYDFSWFPKFAANELKAAEEAEPEQPCLIGLEPWLGVAAKRRVRVDLLRQKYLPRLSLDTGTIFIKSPKGSGKTEQLKELIGLAKLQEQSVLVIGHRQTLLREQARRLDLHCYLDDYLRRDAVPPDYYAVSVDSLSQRISSKRHYDIVIVDESEQVLAHVLADTVRDKMKALSMLQYYFSTATSLYLLDADLNHITYGFADRCRSGKDDPYVHVILNNYVEGERPLEVFDTAHDLIFDLMGKLRSGKRAYVACNSKRQAKTLQKLLTRTLGERVRSLLITADVKSEPDVARFLSDVPTVALEYDVIIATPAIGTGIDISFPRDEQKIDCVYGLFRAGITTHYDCDQQLGRVRRAGSVGVWTENRTFDYVTNRELIEEDIVMAGDVPEAVDGYGPAGTHLVNRAHPLLSLKADVYCAHRASQNDLRGHFMAHMRRNGWTPQRMESPTTDLAAARCKYREAEELVEAERVAGLLETDDISSREYAELKALQANGAAIGRAGELKMKRFELADFYAAPVTDDLVMKDRGGKYREIVSAFEALHLGDPIFFQHRAGALERFRSGESLAATFSVDREGLVWAALLTSGLVGPDGLLMEKMIGCHDLANFTAFARTHRLTFEREISVRIRNDIDRNPVQSLNAVLAEVGLSLEPLGKRRVAGEQVHLHRIDRVMHDAMAEIVERRREAHKAKAEAASAIESAAQDSVEPIDVLVREAAKRLRVERSEERQPPADGFATLNFDDA